MRRDHALETLKLHVKDDIVVAVYQACFDWLEICPRDLNYVSTGAMGQAVSHGMGLALARPNRRVLVFDGDGSILMNLGALVSVAEAGCKNLYHFIFSNGEYEVNGRHPVPGKGVVDFAAIALATGYAHASRFKTLNTFKDSIGAILATPGPAMIVLDVTPGETFRRNYEYIHSAEAREKFRSAIRKR
ncbi:MAG: thiamine pyrophosphate-dependent enzyme [Albidovulum sp.]|nr:thiamine pyrophosphate-dependent enzyme [Albidovulum sp.]MDE0306102.1 thiamine pyrophosphate-dependent enzyme [Albidovulum sp.]MDE0531810.1 thiamine pyrophosphate-dependent enzyme [Albidovulum sp.]